MSFHYTTSIKKPDGIFHVRLYCLDRVTDLTLETSGLMAVHANLLPAEVAIDPSLILAGGIGDWEVQYEDQFFQGTPSFSNMKLLLQADPVLAPLIKAIRSRSEIWCEITVEQRVDHLPAYHAGEMFFPRKERLYFWGKLLIQESKLHLKFQERDDSSYKYGYHFIANQSHREHYGSLDLTFVHWFPFLTSNTPRYFLDDFVLNYGTGVSLNARMSQFLNKLVAWISPAIFYTVSDHRLETTDANEGTDASISRCNFQLPIAIYGADNIDGSGNLGGRVVTAIDTLYQIGFRMTDGSGIVRPLFDKGTQNARTGAWEDIGTYSLYNFGTLGELFVAFCEEFQFKWQCELPIMKESNKPTPGHNGNDLTNRNSHWLENARWLFFDARLPASGLLVSDIYIYGQDTPVLVPKPIYVDPDEDQIDAEPCPSWLGKLTVSDPFANGTTGDIKMHQVMIGVSQQGAKDVNIKTIFAFWQWTTSGITPLLDLGLGPEILVFNSGGSIVVPAWFFTYDQISVGRDGPTAVTKTSYIWPFFQAHRLDGFWNGQDVSTIEFDTPGIGIEPFGVSAKEKFDSIRGYGLLDFGDFPMFRYIVANPSILLDEKVYGEFRLFQIKRTPGDDPNGIGTTHIKAIVVSERSSTTEASTPDPPPPPAPPVINGPPIIGTGTEDLCGAVTLIFGVSYSDTICGVSITIDGVTQTGVIVGSADSSSITPVFFALNACSLAIGPHTICVTVTPCDTRVSPVTTCWTFTVNHNCC